MKTEQKWKATYAKEINTDVPYESYVHSMLAFDNLLHSQKIYGSRDCL